MDISKTKDMIVLKDVPSNIVEEAYIVLKPNIKQKIKVTKKMQRSTMPVYIMKEAESVVSNYLSTIEKNRIVKNTEIEKIRKKNKNLKKICMGLCGLWILNLLLQLI